MKREASAFVLCSVNDWHLQPVSQSSLSNPNRLISARLAWTGLGSAEPDWSLNQLDGAGVTGARALTLFDWPATGPISQAGKVDAVDAVIYCPAVKAAHTNSRAGTLWGR